MNMKKSDAKIQEVEIKTPKQLKEVLIQCEIDDIDNLPLFAIRKYQDNHWEDWFLDYSNGIRYADSDEIDQNCKFLKEEAERLAKEISL
jgi:hypothetical protein